MLGPIFVLLASSDTADGNPPAAVWEMTSYRRILYYHSPFAVSITINFHFLMKAEYCTLFHLLELKLSHDTAITQRDAVINRCY